MMAPSRKRRKTFLLVIPSFEDIFHSYYAGEIIKGVSLAATRLKADILIHITDRFSHKDWLDSHVMDRNYIDGIIFGDIDSDVQIAKKAIARHIPTIVLNNFLAEPFNCIAIDNYKATFDVIDHLVRLKHTRIATIAGDLTTQAGIARLQGFQDAMAKHRLEVPRNYITEGGFLRTPAREAAQKLLKLKNRPTAIFAASDVMALEVMDVAKTLGVRVPEELSVVGFDDNPIAASSSVALTTVYQPIVEMARLGAEYLKQISIGQAKLPVKILLPARLIVRKSSMTCAVSAS